MWLRRTLIVGAVLGIVALAGYGSTLPTPTAPAPAPEPPAVAAYMANGVTPEVQTRATSDEVVLVILAVVLGGVLIRAVVEFAPYVITVGMLAVAIALGIWVARIVL